MNPFLKAFYAQISAENGMSVACFQMELRRLFKRPRSDNDLNDYRLSRPPWKKLADEVVPVSRFLQFRGIELRQIRFPLDNQPPDCWLWKDGENAPTGIEVTIAQARERYHLRKELVETGSGRSFIGVSDDAPQADFDHPMSKPREAFSTDQTLPAIRDGILRCLARKSEANFAGFDLLIQAPLSLLPEERWEAIKGDLCMAAAKLPFREIWAISDSEGRYSDGSLWGFQIK